MGIKQSKQPKINTIPPQCYYLIVITVDAKGRNRWCILADYDYKEYNPEHPYPDPYVGTLRQCESRAIEVMMYEDKSLYPIVTEIFAIPAKSVPVLTPNTYEETLSIINQNTPRWFKNKPVFEDNELGNEETNSHLDFHTVYAWLSINGKNLSCQPKKRKARNNEV